MEQKWVQKNKFLNLNQIVVEEALKETQIKVGRGKRGEKKFESNIVWNVLKVDLYFISGLLSPSRLTLLQTCNKPGERIRPFHLFSPLSNPDTNPASVLHPTLILILIPSVIQP